MKWEGGIFRKIYNKQGEWNISWKSKGEGQTLIKKDGISLRFYTNKALIITEITFLLLKADGILFSIFMSTQHRPLRGCHTSFL